MRLQRAVLYFITQTMLMSACCMHAQSPCPTQVLQTAPPPSASPDLICLVPQVYGPGGLVGQSFGGPLDDTTSHNVHFQASSVRSFAPINAEIGVQLSQLPIAAPVAGFIFADGVMTPTTSFGPVLTDRAETIGRKKTFVSLSYQYFNFDKVDGINLRNFGAVFTHELETPCDGGLPNCYHNQPLYVQDIVATQNSIDLKVHQITFVATYGIIDKLDISVAVPVLNVRMGMGSSATITNFEVPPGDGQDGDHRFDSDYPDPIHADFHNAGYSFGMGDITLRMKYLAWQGEKTAVAFGADFRLPTGDVSNFLGTGTWGVRPFGIYTQRFGRWSPHASVGIQGNGDSVLAGDTTSNPVTKARIPTDFSYSAGSDISLFRRVGVSVDYIGRSLLHGYKVRTSSFEDYRNDVHPNLTTSADTINLSSAAVGIKVNPFGNFLFTGNVLFRLNDAGLHAKPAPLFGMSYIF